jgi:hypothetical protein
MECLIVLIMILIIIFINSYLIYLKVYYRLLIKMQRNIKNQRVKKNSFLFFIFHVKTNNFINSVKFSIYYLANIIMFYN